MIVVSLNRLGRSKHVLKRMPLPPLPVEQVQGLTIPVRKRLVMVIPVKQPLAMTDPADRGFTRRVLRLDGMALVVFLGRSRNLLPILYTMKSPIWSDFHCACLFHNRPRPLPSLYIGNK